MRNAKLPGKTTFVVKDKKGIVTLSYWCKTHGMKYNTVQARAWRAGLSSDSPNGLVTLDPKGAHREIFKRIKDNDRPGKKAKEGVEGEVRSEAVHGDSGRDNAEGS